MSEWGIGRVSGQTSDGKVLIKFSGRPGDVLLTAAGAASHLSLDKDAQWADTPKSRKRVAAIKKIPCSTCAKDLRQSFAYQNGGWKACPECSAKNGKQHVFQPGEAFEYEANGSAKDAAHGGWCVSCRTGGTVTKSKLCSDFRTERQ
jgi:hypothetical protein